MKMLRGIIRVARYLAIIGCCAMGFATIVATGGCGGGGGGGGEQLPPAQNVTISGKVDDGTANSPIPNAVCRFVDTGQKEHAMVFSDWNGEFRIIVSPGLEGHVRCSPLDLPYLTIYTFSSTKGRAAGEMISGENVTPATTVVADIIKTENPTDPIARKQELLASIAALQDADLALVAKVSTMLYKAMYEQGINVDFGGDGEGGDGGGAGGDAGDGGDFSPIPNARCEFIVGDNLKEREVLYSAALADFLYYGKVNRLDLKKIADLVNQALGDHTSEQIKAAFGKFFTEGIGQPYSATADGKGSYFLPIPPNVPGFVRCIPPNQEKLVLGTYVAERQAGETLLGQDVNPATTIFSNNIASNLAGDLGATKENFLDDIEGLDVQILQKSGTVTGFQLRPGTSPANKDVGLVAFSATALFNSFYKNGINGDYLTVLDDLIVKKAVDPVFLTTQGLPAAQAEGTTNSVNITALNLGTNLNVALSKAYIKVRVTDTPGGQIINGANVEITGKPSNVTCSPGPSCPVGTITGGKEYLFTLEGVPTVGDTQISVRASGVAGFDAVTATASVVAFATVDLEIALSQPVCAYSISPSPASKDFTSSGGTGSIVVTVLTGTGCSWTAVSNAPSWITITTGPNYSGNQTVGYSVSANPGPSSRTGTMTIAGQTFTVNQAAPPPPVCTYSFSSTSASYGSGSGTGSVSVTVLTGTGCSWTAVSNAPSWITIPTGPNYSGNQTVGYSVSANPGPSSRTGTMTIAGQTFTVNQAAPPPVCTYSFSSTSASFGSGSETGSVSVTVLTGTGCSWTAVSNAAWITITSGGSYSGNGTVSYSVSANPGPSSRSGTMTIAGQTFTVNQTFINTPPTISNANAIVLGVNDPSCNLYGNLPSQLGSLFRVTFNYTDSNGNGPINISQAKLDIAYDFPLGVDGYINDYTWNSSLSGDGFSGTATTRQCYRFGSNTYVDVTMTIEDLLGATSNALTVTINKPAGSN